MYQSRCMTKNSWWWVERLPETCRVVIPIKLEFSAYVGFIRKESVTMYGHTYLFTPWSRVLLEKLTGSAASQEIPRIFETRRFLTVLTSARHLSLSWANYIQSPQPPPISWRSILILSSHLRLGHLNGLFHARSYDRKKIRNFFFGLTSHLADCFICHKQWTQDVYLNNPT